jgi:hypothetical protein
LLRRDSRSEPESPPSGMSGRILSTVNTVPITRKKGRAGPAHDGAALNSLCSGEPPARRRRRTSAREPKRYKPRPTGPHWTNQTHPYRAQNATARTQQHGSELWSPVRDEEAAGSNPVTPTSATGRSPSGMPCPARDVPLTRARNTRLQGTKRDTREPQGMPGPTSTDRRTPGLPATT